MMIKDIRGSTKDTNTTEQLIHEIVSKAKKHQLPTMILYDQKGLEIFDKITYHEDYYLTNSEIDILETYSEDIVRDFVSEGDVLIELGAGAMRKTRFLLDAIQKSGKRITYYAVDLQQQSLQESLEPLQKQYPTINFVGLWGTYHDSLAFVQKNVPQESRKMFLWLGSSIGNLTREEARKFLHTFCEEGMNDGDLFLCGIDKRNDPKRIGLAYNDRAGLTRDFSMNGLDHINRLFGFKLIDPKGYEYVSIYNDVAGRHEAYYRPISDQHIVSKDHDLNVTFKKGELINFEYSYKYSMEEVMDLLTHAGLGYLGKMSDKAQLYDLHM
jgi:L-histidine Nalpha-methyltransferase / hercynylcysteine S-oxide synthase